MRGASKGGGITGAAVTGAEAEPRSGRWARLERRQLLADDSARFGLLLGRE